MSIHKKNIIIFILLDIAYFILSVNTIVSYYIPESANWYAFLPFIMILTLGGYGLFIYRGKTNQVLPITKNQYMATRILTLTFLIVYVVQMILIPDPLAYPALLSIIIGSFLAVVACVGLGLTYYLGATTSSLFFRVIIKEEKG